MEDIASLENLFRTFLSLAFVVALMFAIAWVVKKYLRPDQWGLQLSGIKIVHTLPLDTKRKLAVVEVEGKRLLVGIGQDSITALTELESKTLASVPNKAKGEVYAQASN